MDKIKLQKNGLARIMKVNIMECPSDGSLSCYNTESLASTNCSSLSNSQDCSSGSQKSLPHHFLIDVYTCSFQIVMSHPCGGRHYFRLRPSITQVCTRKELLAFVTLSISSKGLYTQLVLHFLWDALKTVLASLLLYDQFRYHQGSLIRSFVKELLPIVTQDISFKH